MIRLPLPHSMNIGHWLAWLLAALLGLGLLFSSITASQSHGAVQGDGGATLNQRPATPWERPDWTERAAFTWGDDLYIIGVASRARTTEEGRQRAFDNGQREIRNYLQGVALNGLTITTERTYEELQADGSVTVWRLLRVSLEELQKAPAKRIGAGPDASKINHTRAKPVDLEKEQTCTGGLATIPVVMLWCWATW